MSYCGSDCVSCSQICDCIQLTSPEGSILINKDGCKWSLEWNPDSFIVNSGLLFTEETRELCMEVNGEISCVTIPDEDDQYLTLDGNNLSIVKPDGTVINSIDLSVLQITFAATSNSLSITPGGPYGHTPNIEIIPSSDADNVFVLGTDGRPYVPETLVPPQVQTPITAIDTNTIDITTSGTNQHTISADLRYEDSNSIDLSDSSTGLKADLKIDPNSTADISITQYGLLVNKPTLDVNILPVQGISFTKTVSGSTITFTPVLDYIYIASQICPLCPPPSTPCNAPSVTISGITDGTFTINVSPLAAGDTYDVSLDNGITWPYTGITAVNNTITGLIENSTYQVVVRLHCALGGTVSTVEQDAHMLDCPDITNLAVTVSGTTANLTWTVPTLSTIQQPQYKLSTVGTYTNTAITTSGSISVNGLLVNRIYDFRINNTCHTPNTSVSNNAQAIAFSCPGLSLTGSSQTTINYSYTIASGTSITNVKIELLNSTGGTVLQTQNKVPPLNSGTFTGLAAGTAYKVRLTLQAQGTSQVFQSVCPNVDVSTQAIPPTIYAQLEYQGASAGTCTANTFFSFIRTTAYWRTYSNSACTIPYVIPSGYNCAISYVRYRRQSHCACSTGLSVTIDNAITYNLTLATATNQTLVPNTQKYSGEDWYYCVNEGATCSGGGPFPVCAQDTVTNIHWIDENSWNTTGVIPVTFAGFKVI